MEQDEKPIASEIKTEDFDFGKHFKNAVLASLYYLFVFIPFILPYRVWEKAATRISMLWESKSIGYKEGDTTYPLFDFYFRYISSFLFDAAIFLTWVLGIPYVIYFYIDLIDSYSLNYSGFFKALTYTLFFTYLSVVFTRLAKEAWIYIINNLITWILDVLVNIGKLLKNMWLLNFVYKNKSNSNN